MEAGAGSAVLALSETAHIPLATTQADLTPFQRMVLTMEMKRQAEAARSQQHGHAHGAGSLPGAGRVNSLAAPRGGGTGETVTYVNTHRSGS